MVVEGSNKAEGFIELESSYEGLAQGEGQAEGLADGRRAAETSKSRDFMIMPRRQAPLPPITTSDPHNGLCDSPTQSSIPFPSPFDAFPLPEPASPTKLPSCSTPQRTKSTTSIAHPPVSPPQYTVRSQPIGLSRSNSFSEIAPTISGGLTRRLSVSSLSSEGEEADEEDPTDSKPLNRPLFKHRSESLPAFPPRKLVAESQERQKFGENEADLAQLPSNPKLWLPSHLALYLSNALSLHPALAADITAFIRNSRLSGRTFLRLKSADLEELGVNIRWRGALLEAGDKLRRESLGGRLFWGYEGGRQSDEDEEKDKRSKAQASIGLSYPTSSILPISHRRRPSLEVEGSASEDESSKEEWKRSWRRLNRGTNRVKGLAKTFETVIETSERSINVSPAGSPVKHRTDSSQRPSRIWSSHEADDVSFAGSSRRRTDSVDSNMSAASVDSFSGRYASSNAIQSSSGGSHHSSPSLVANLSSPELDSAFARPSPVTPIKKSSPADQRVSFAEEFDWRLYPDSPGLRRNIDRDSNGEAYEEEEEEEEQTLKPVRTASTTSGGSSGNYALSPASTEKRAGLADLFGLELPKTRRETKKGNDGDEMVEMLVPGIETIGKGGRKGSVVLIKKSQFAALQRRMSEVEAQVALALESNGLTSPRKLHSDEKENEVERLEKSLIGLEHQTRLLAAISTPDRSPLKDRNYHSPLCPTRSRSTTTDDEVYQEDPKTWWTEDTNLGWRALGGYVVAASIGIGIVAGEVVASKLFGVRRR